MPDSNLLRLRTAALLGCAGWLACASFVAPLAAAEVKSTEGVEPLYHATRWTAEDGLPQMRISAPAQTPDGYLWAGTWFGLARFDGVRFVVFNSANTPELRKESITALAVDRADGALWIGTPEGLLRLKDRRFTCLSEPHELSTSGIADLVPAAGGGVWVWTDGVVALWRGRLLALAPLHLGLLEGHRGAWETEEGHLVVATGRRCLEVAKGWDHERLAVADGRSDPSMDGRRPGHGSRAASLAQHPAGAVSLCRGAVAGTADVRSEAPARRSLSGRPGGVRLGGLCASRAFPLRRFRCSADYTGRP